MRRGNWSAPGIGNPDTEEPGDPKRGDNFQYDELGNRKQWNNVASRGAMLILRKDTRLNQYLSWENSYPNPPLHWGGPTNYDADLGGGWGAPGAANGVLMQDGHITASFNALNQPMGIWAPAYGWGESAQWLWSGFDPLGRCVKRWMGTSTGVPISYIPATYYYYDGWSLLQEGNAEGNTARLYVHGGRIDEIVKSFNYGNGQSAYHHYDARTHCILLSNASGGILEQYDYDAFGLPYFYNAAGAKQGPKAYGNRFLFTGREYLSDLKLYDYRNRLYQPELGRFLQPDPKQFEAGDYNLYRYCHNDPINRNDPLGLDPIIVSDEEDAKAHEGLSNSYQTMIANRGWLGSLYEYSTTVFRDGTGNLSLSDSQSIGESDMSVPPERKGFTSVVETHSHGLNIARNKTTDSLLSERDVKRGNQTGRPQYAISPDGKTRQRFRPDDDAARRAKDPLNAGGAIERWNNGRWEPVPGANTDLRRPHAGKNWPLSQ